MTTDTISDQHSSEVAAGERFEFGKNWAAFLAVLDDERIATAVESLKTMRVVDCLAVKSFLVICSCSSLFLLAARKLVPRVHSFDFDSNSFACTQALRDRCLPADPYWRVE